MGKKKKTKHGPRDAYEEYELEHMPHRLEKFPSDHGQPRKSNEKPVRDHYRTKRTDQIFNRASTADESYEMIGYDENVDAEAEAFIKMEHEKFEMSKWMSMNGY